MLLRWFLYVVLRRPTPYVACDICGLVLTRERRYAVRNQFTCSLCLITEATVRQEMARE